MQQLDFGDKVIANLSIFCSKIKASLLEHQAETLLFLQLISFLQVLMKLVCFKPL